MSKAQRIQNVYRPKDERVQDYKEVERPFSHEEMAAQADRCGQCGLPFCHGCGCPLHNVIPEMNFAVSKGDYQTAYAILSETSCFPEFTSRVCPALCEGSCVGGLNGQPVMIRQIEKQIIETAFEKGWVNPKSPDTPVIDKKIAVIGAGPAGLAMAHTLSCLGYKVTVYEREKAAGGLLRYGIPNFKLEKGIIDRRIKVMESMGVKFVYETEVGKDVSADYLNRRYDAIAVAIGTPIPRDLNVPGRELRNIHVALDFLGGQNKYLTKEVRKTINVKDKNVVVIGGGDTGSDCVGTSIRQGAKNVTQIEIMPMPPIEQSASTPWPNWPYLLRTSSSHKEGGERHWSILTKAFVGDKGKVTGIEVVDVDWEIDPLGRPVKFTEKPDASRIISADYVFLAMGFLGVPTDGITTELDVQRTERGALVEDIARKIFVCGDAATGQSLIVRAIEHAKQQAYKLHTTLSHK